jgi:hypothetical protein
VEVVMKCSSERMRLVLSNFDWYIFRVHLPPHPSYKNSATILRSSIICTRHKWSRLVVVSINLFFVWVGEYSSFPLWCIHLLTLITHPLTTFFPAVLVARHAPSVVEPSLSQPYCNSAIATTYSAMERVIMATSGVFGPYSRKGRRRN